VNALTPLKVLAVSLLRTVVSSAWVLFIGWLIVTVPAFQPLEAQLLEVPELVLPIIVSVAAAAWYALWRWVEPKLPAWLTRALLGSSKAPVYPAITGSQVPGVNPPADRVPGPDHRA
jgi:hypothetical protein